MIGAGMMRRALLVTAGAVLLLGATVLFAARLSPWPGVLLIQWMFSRGETEVDAKLEKYLPPDVITQTDIAYGPGPDDQMDLNRASAAAQAMPVVVWVHGGAWIAGTKDGVSRYLQILTTEGFATVGVEYSTGFGSHYPRPVEQVNQALGYLSAQDEKLGLDGNRIVLAGDSAGAQIAAQVALLTTDPDYAERLGIRPAISATQLKGVVLVSGAFDLQSIDFEGEWAWFINTVLWAYSGMKDFMGDERFAMASVQEHIGANFPPTYLTSGNADPLEPQARRFATRLADLGVPVTSLFFSPDQAPPLPHEYQFDLDLPQARQAFSEIGTFVRKAVGLTSKP